MLAWRTETNRACVFEKVTGGLQLPQIPLVDLIALTLEIRTEISADLRTFVPVEPEPAQPVVDRGRSFGRVARFVGILDAQDKCAAVWRAKSQLKSAVRAPPMCR